MRLRTREERWATLSTDGHGLAVCVRASECQQVLSPIHNDTHCISTRLSLSLFHPLRRRVLLPPQLLFYIHYEADEEDGRETVFLILAGRN